MLQFLVESGAMALLGGFFGVMIGIAIAQVVTLVIGFPSTVKLWSVLVGLGMATSVGNILRRVSGVEGGEPGSDCGAAGGAVRNS